MLNNFGLFFEDITLNIKTKILDIEDYINYKVSSNPLPSENTPKVISVIWEKDPKTKTYSAVFPDYPEIIATADTGEGIINNVNEAVYEYFEVPRYLAKLMGNKYTPPDEAFSKLVKDETRLLKTKLPKLAETSSKLAKAPC